MQTIPKSYTDIDYESFPIADLDLDRHWVQLPNSVLAERRQARQQNASASPLFATGHKIILVPADPTYSPIEEEIWPIINHTVQQRLRPYPELRSTINAAVIQAMADHPSPPASNTHPAQNPLPAQIN